MDVRAARSDTILLMTAMIWGFAFAFQRAGMEFVGPFTYSALRFSLGIIVLLPFRRWEARRFAASAGGFRRVLLPGAIAGVLLTTGVTFQQVGLVYTSAGKAGFITGLYVVLVPVLGILAGRSTGPGGWAGAICAAVGLYLLSVVGRLEISLGDLLVLASAFFWAVHVLVIDRIASRIPFVTLAILQYAICAVANAVIALATETISFTQVFDAAIPIIYGGALSVGIAYTLQIVGQRDAPPTHAAIILSLEGVFAAVGGLMILGEVLAFREIVGCLLILAGMLISQLTQRRRRALA